MIVGGRPIFERAVSSRRQTRAGRLERLGLWIALLSGDDPVTARAIGRDLGIDDVVGGNRVFTDDRGLDDELVVDLRDRERTPPEAPLTPSTVGKSSGGVVAIVRIGDAGRRDYRFPESAHGG